MKEDSESSDGNKDLFGLFGGHTMTDLEESYPVFSMDEAGHAVITFPNKVAATVICKSREASSTIREQILKLYSGPQLIGLDYEDYIQVLRPSSVFDSRVFTSANLIEDGADWVEELTADTAGDLLIFGDGCPDMPEFSDFANALEERLGNNRTILLGCNGVDPEEAGMIRISVWCSV